MTSSCIFSKAHRLSLFAALLGALFLCGAADSALGRPPSAPPENGNENLASLPAIAKRKPLAPRESDGKTAKVVTQILENYHFIRQEIDSKISARFLDRYMDSMDFQRLHFTQEDEAEYQKWAASLGSKAAAGDVAPAYILYQKFLERIFERATFVLEELKTQNFDFNGTDRCGVDRRKAPRPANKAEAQALWKERLKYEILQERLNHKTNEEITKIISRRYIRMVRAALEFDSEQVLQTFLTSLAHVYDPHSDYLGASELENFAIGMKLSLVGIGALLSSEDGYCVIRELIAGGPAARQGILRPKDKIIEVAQGETGEPVDVVDMNLNKVVDMIRGKKGTRVRLTIIPANATDSSVRRVVTIQRDEVKLEEQEAKAKLFDIPGEKGQSLRVGVIDLPSFYADFNSPVTSLVEPKSTTTDVEALLKKLTKEGAKGIILDLRRNGGGSLAEAIRLTGLFIPYGPVVQIRDSAGKVDVQRDINSKMGYAGPLLVLTSRFSASASEIVAGALQDYGRAVIMGDSATHGKGTVQSLVQLETFFRQLSMSTKENPGALKLTVQKFYRPTGSSTQLKGVIPDIILPSLNDAREVGESSLENPLPWDQIQPSDFTPMNWVGPMLPALRQRSALRVSTSADFTYLNEDITELKRITAEKFISLNETERLREKEVAHERRERRRKERAARVAPYSDTFIELHLRDVANPGLPAPRTRADRLAEVRRLRDRASNGETDEEDSEIADEDFLVDPIFEEALATMKDMTELVTVHPCSIPPELKGSIRPAPVLE